MKSKDIAKLLGVSKSTISLVINNKKGVSDERRKEIIDKIKEMGCENLLRDKDVYKNSIGFVVYKRESRIIDQEPFFSFFLENINKQVKKQKYNLSIFYLDKETSYKEQERIIKSCNCKGLIVFAVEMIPDDLEPFKKAKIPFVTMDNSFQTCDVNSVSIDNEQSIYKAVKYLYEAGHRSIGYVKSKIKINSFSERYESYLKILQNLNLDFSEDNIIEVEYGFKEAINDINQYLEKKRDLPTAFIADNDILAYSSIESLKNNGYNVPKDVSIIGFDDRPISSNINPKLTTSMIPRKVFSNIAVNLLLNNFGKDEDTYVKIKVGTKFIERESVKIIK